LRRVGAQPQTPGIGFVKLFFISSCLKQSMTTLLLSNFIDINDVYTDFKKFVTANGIATVVTGVIIGISTTTFLRAATEDVFIPLLDVLFLGSFRFLFPKISNNVGHTNFKLDHFAIEALVWVVMLVAAFFVVKLVFLNHVDLGKQNTNP
jgi:large-conductance mechanosensitive channel